MEAYEETAERYKELPAYGERKKKKRRAELGEKDELGVCPTSLDRTNFSGPDWESIINKMEEEVNSLLNAMVQLLGVSSEVALLQFELLLKSLSIRTDYILLVLKALKKEYVYEQEECEILKKIWDVEMKHWQLIKDAHIILMKRGTYQGNKKQKLAEIAEEEENNNVDGNQLVLRIETLEDIQDKLEKINEESRNEVLRIAQKYSQIRKPVFEKRNDIIKDIPNFWLMAFLRHPMLRQLVSTEEEHEVFKFLSSMEVQDSEDVKCGYTINFYFNPNPHFRNALLSKTYTFLKDGRPAKVTASTIQWSERNGSVSPHVEDSFFRWFSNEVNPKDDEVAALIKDELWPNPLIFFSEADEENYLHDADGEETDEEDREAADHSGNEVVSDTEGDNE
ncbi:hypothetical protein HAX54_008652 [Datura stramonium]|uniref:Protein SET n=1 Tax=Datura stramonium TaxID=4076 RepID=A0ABS8WXS9_DATST|nr:hypothetical protein [Datura stramonium]